MKHTFVQHSLCLCMLIAGNTAVAQENTVKVRPPVNRYTISNDEAGKARENIQTVINDTTYTMEIINGKLSALYVNGKLVPANQYSPYENTISKIKELARLDNIQAKKDQEQAMRNQQQAKTDQQQATQDQNEAKLAQEDARQDQAHAKLNLEQASQHQVQAKLDQEQAGRDQAGAKLNAEKAAKDMLQAKISQEQAMKDQQLAKLDQEQAEEDQRMLKQFVNDLIKDGIIADEKSLLTLTISASGMTVNDKKQTEDVYIKYKERYPRFSSGNFSYSNSPNGNKNIRLHRP